MLVSAIHQHESATGIHMSPPSWIPLPSPAPSHLLRLSQSTGLSLLCHTAKSHLLSVLHMVIYMFPHYSQFVPPFPSSIVCTSLFSMYASPLLSCKWVHWYQLSRFHMHVLIYNEQMGFIFGEYLGVFIVLMGTVMISKGRIWICSFSQTRLTREPWLVPLFHGK